MSHGTLNDDVTKLRLPQVRLCDDAPVAQQDERHEAVGAALD